MRASPARYAIAALAGLASFAAAGWSMVWQITDAQLLGTRAAAQIAPVPDNILPPGTPQPPEQPPLTAAEHETLARGLWRDPLDPKLFDLLYADAVRTGAPDARIDRLGGLLAALGWRYTPAQQNLIMRAALEGRFTGVVDRVDALLRRQKLPALAFSVLSAMEALPQVHGVVVARLAADPEWRHDYLTVIGPQAPPALLDARVRTLAALLRTPTGLSREDMAPSLAVLVANGRGRAAYALWMQHAGRPAGGLVYDPGFRQAAAEAGKPDLGIPFEWRLTQDLGYDVETSPEGGVSVTWDRRGAPVFAAQTVPVAPGRRYQLMLRGRADRGGLQDLLVPTLTCGNATVRFQPVAAGGNEARYRSDAVPAGCDLAVLAINGGVDTGSGSVTFDVAQVDLRPFG